MGFALIGEKSVRAGERATRRVSRAYEAWRAQILSFAGQATVSLVSFFTTVALGRFASERELGVYAMGMSILIVLLQLVDPLFGRPYLVLRYKHAHEDAQYAGRALAMCVALSILATVLILLSAVFSAGDVRLRADFALAVAAAVPFWMGRGFLRALSVAKGRFGAYLWLDSLSSFLQAACVAVLVASGRLGAATAMFAVAASSAASVLRTLWTLRGEFSYSARGWASQIREFWAFGRWLLATQVGASINIFAAQWALALLIGVDAVGAYAAYMSISLICNPFLLAIANLIGATSSNVLAEGGPQALLRDARTNALLLASGLGAFLITILVFEPEVIRLLYPGLLPRNERGLVALLVAGHLLGAVGMPASSALASMERPKGIAAVSFLTAVVSASLVSVLTCAFGLYGAAAAFAASSAVGSLGRWAAFSRALRNWTSSRGGVETAPPDGGAALDALWKAASAAPGRAGLEIASASVLGIGDQAWAYRLDFAETCGHPSPPLVVKLYRPGGRVAVDEAGVRRQFFAALRLYAALSNRRSDRWHACAPRPHAVVAEPLALVSDFAPGVRLDMMLAEVEGDDHAVREIAGAVLFAVSACWEAGFSHGDLTFDNILCGRSNGGRWEVSLIDAGTAECCSVCQGRSGRTSCEVADLAHFASDIVWQSRHFARAPILTFKAFERRRRFARLLLNTHVAGIPDERSRERFRGELRAWARRHVAQTFALESYFLRPWHAFRKWWFLREFA